MKEAQNCITCNNTFIKSRKNQIACNSVCAYEYRKLKARESSDRLYKERVPRDRYQQEPNELIYHKDYIEMNLYNRIGNKVGSTILDKKSVDILKGRKWGLVGNYVVTYKKNKPIFLHNEILKTSIGKCCDHINRDTMDNRINNLREVTKTENCYNRGMLKNNTSGFKGVHPSNNKWVARIEKDKKVISLGTYGNFNDAVSARREAEIKYFGEFAPVGVTNE